MKTFLALLLVSIIGGSSLQGQVVISKFLAKNDVVLADENGEYDDWIEIHNPGNKTVDIGGYYITDDQNEPMKFQISEGDGATEIEPGGYLILWADEDTEDGVLHLDIKLSGDGEEIFLYLPDGKTLVDSVVFDKQEDDVSYGRKTDTGKNWITFKDPTPKASNKTTTFFTHENISKIKVYPNPYDQELVFKNIPDKCRLQLSDMNGQLVHSQKLQTGKNYLDLSSLSPGAYIFNIRTTKNQFVKRGKIVRK